MTEVRLAAKKDAKEIIDIYAPSILDAAISFETEVPSAEEMQKRIEMILQTYPWIVCVVDGEIAGYVYGSKYRDREAYQWSCECTVYIHDQYKGKGVGRELYGLLFQLLQLQGFRTVYAVVTLPNEGSVNLHEKCGFEKFAVFENVGYKFGQWHSVGWWKLRLNDYTPDPPPPLKFSELDTEMITDLFQKAAQRIQSKLTG
jgi:L-amino acid N-acyltransferase YncA